MSLDIGYIKKILLYCPKSGKLTWRRRGNQTPSWNTRFAGKEAGSLHNSNGITYKRVVIDGKKYYAHRLAYAIHHGEWPSVIDHIDGDGLNNKAENLRGVTQSENQKNHRLHKDNKSGISGVHFSDRLGKFVVRIGKSHLGCYETLLDACAARISTAANMGYLGVLNDR